ncbi:MAG: FAD-dependent oxidoreductase [Lachnospiraceae bacterium]|nr:FAD-dependent oxidoreductase [Lachnospiraceae bacterium]
MLQLSQCKVPCEKNTRAYLIKKVARQLHIKPEDIREFTLVKKSVDARKKPDIFFSYTVRFQVPEENQVMKKNKGNKNLTVVARKKKLEEKITPIRTKKKIVVVGAGPAGLFCAYYLSLCGCRPMLIERGAPMEERTKAVKAFWETGVLNPENNVSFGEGGAGTFSDGKLNTGVKDKSGKKQFVLESFVKFGAGEDILYDSKPHIGTDILREVIVNMRREMEEKGCEFHFHTKLTGLTIEKNVVKMIQVEKEGEKREIPCDKLILAIGHSARDTFSMLHKSGLAMSPKAFAVGVRVQHLQEDIDLAQYGVKKECLPVSSYKCTGKTKDGRGVYSFCMCPGGYVVNASSEQGGLVVNGMSNAKRDSGNANSAIVVTVEPEDFGGSGCLAGIAFQEKWEKEMYELCQGKIPVQRYDDFCKDEPTTEFGRVTPCVKGDWQMSNLRRALPKFIVNGMIDGMEQFRKKIENFAKEDTLLLGIETRTSSPVRIERDEDFVSISAGGIYPCGEGAGYAGGIMSAAMDGLRVAIRLTGQLKDEMDGKEGEHASTVKR